MLIFGLLEEGGMWAVGDLVRYFLAAVGREAVQDDYVLV
jgi:hypothetical protein